MKTAISLDDELFASGEALSKRLKMSRSRLYAQALADFVAKYRTSGVTARLDEVYAQAHDGVPTLIRGRQARTIARDAW